MTNHLHPVVERVRRLFEDGVISLNMVWYKKLVRDVIISLNMFFLYFGYRGQRNLDQNNQLFPAKIEPD